MRIERINENSIRCTLTSFDLSVRNLNLKELSYGSEKARKLFEEMMTKAGNEFGFHAEGTPIMVEAIPMSADSIQLIISKVPDPEELDARFSRFTQNPAFRKQAESILGRLTSALLEGADNLGLSGQPDSSKETQAEGLSPASAASSESTDASAQTVASSGKAAAASVHTHTDAEFRVFAFPALDAAADACRAAAMFDGNSILYKSPSDGRYVLVVESTGCAEDSFSKTCNVLAEYGRMLKTVKDSVSYFDEHYQVIVREKAIGKLSRI